MTSPDSLNIHEFARPPVIETVLGVQFNALSKFTNAHLGAFWKHLGGDWPNVNDAAIVQPQFERFGEVGIWANIGFKLQLTQDQSSRIQIKNAANDRMVQLQNGRLHYNWLGKDNDVYPRYSAVRLEFDKSLSALEQFLLNAKLGELKANQWEVTYVNHIPKGTLWNSPTDWASIFRGSIVPPTESAAVQLESFSNEFHYEIPKHRGRLHVSMQHARRDSSKGQEVLLLRLTARGPVQEGTRLSEGLDLGHETIVKAFKDLTSDKAHEHWGLIQ